MRYYARKRRSSSALIVLSVLGALLLKEHLDRLSRLGPATGKRPAGTKPGSGLAKKGQSGAFEINGPKKRAYTKAELDAMRARAQKRAEEQARQKLPRIEGTVSASPELEHRHGQTPAGHDPLQARAQARGIAAHLTKKGPRAYSVSRLAIWQTYAGIRADGNYGGSTRGALIYYGAIEPPRPYVDPFATLPYHPPE